MVKSQCSGRARAVRGGLTVLALTAAITACSKQAIIGGDTKQIAGAMPTDGYLPQPELLQAGNGLWDLVYLKPGIDFHTYKAVYIAPVAIVSGPNSQLASASPALRDELADTFYSDIYTAVSKSCIVAPAAGPGVVVFNVALSDATSSDGAAKTIATYVPYVNVAYKLGSTAFNGGVGYFSGTATAEAYATDGATGALLWQGVDKRGGNAPLVQNTTDEYLDVHHAFQAWAGQLVTRLQQVGICEPPAPT
jgi:hypothetical protein